MEKFIIEGGHPLTGDVTPAGNKNAALPLLAAVLLTEGEVVLRNVPAHWRCRVRCCSCCRKWACASMRAGRR